MFVAQQPSFDFERRAIAGVHESADAAARKNAMAGNHQWYAIRPAGAADRPWRTLDLFREADIGRSAAARNRVDGAPHAFLKLRSPELER